MARGNQYRLDLVFLKRFKRCISIILPNLTSHSFLLFTILLGCNLGQQLFIYNVGLLPSQFFAVLGAKEREAFKSLVFLSLGLIAGVSVTNAAVKFVSGKLHVTWRGLLTEYIHSQYFYDRSMYYVNYKFSDLDNADQRITQDVDRFCQVLSDMSAKLIISPLTIVYYSYQCFANAGYLGPVTIYVYFVVGTIINRLVMAPIVGIVVQQEEREGNFRFRHMDLRVNAEAIGFMRSEQIERVKASEALKGLLKTQQRIVSYEFWLNFAVNLFDYIGSILSYIVIAIPIFAGTYNNLEPIALSSLISRNAFVSIYLINCFSTLMDLSGKVKDMAGYAHRIGELITTLDSINKLCLTRKDAFDQLACHFSKESSVPAFELTDVSYVAPDGNNPLVQGLNLTLSQGKPVLITGKTGAGKSSLLRILSNLWQPTLGKVHCYIPIDSKGVMFLPQQPFLTTGTLIDQVIYPSLLPLASSEQEKVKKRVETCIEDVGLLSLINRIGGVDVPANWDWYKALSPGETQRLCFARVFFHCPKFAVLDEPTSALGEVEEDCFYTNCAKLGITTISVGHQKSLRQYHDQILNLKGDGNWDLTDVKENQE